MEYQHRRFWLELIKDAVKWTQPKLRPIYSFLFVEKSTPQKDSLAVVKFLRRWLTTPLFLIVFSIAYVLYPHSGRVIYADPIAPAVPVVKIKPDPKLLPDTNRAFAENVSPAETPRPAPAPVSAPAPTYNATYGGTGDASLDWIISHESGGNPYAVNAGSGACGLGQSLPCSKVLSACGSLSNVACQINWVRSYCISAYGSTYAAMLFWQAHRWY